MVEPILEVEGLKTHFKLREGMLKAVDGISFSLAPDEVLCIVGESGSGKSVTAQSILRLIDPPGYI
ncbi:MAG TPA: ATP-binding cassette domain-containing protein, partial [Alphaproteobacteria bacterium]|nr:ATP-binding cassette domain-containing protein [Alphaproteobacteria bacterium]